MGACPLRPGPGSGRGRRARLLQRCRARPRARLPRAAAAAADREPRDRGRRAHRDRARTPGAAARPARAARRAAAARRRAGRGSGLALGHPRDAAGVADLARARRRHRPLDPVAGLVAVGRRPLRRDHGAADRGRRRAPHRPGATFPAPLVDSRRRGGHRARDRLRLDRAGGAGADLQQVRGPAGGQPGARRRARARPRGRGRDRRGLPDRCQPPRDLAQRVRRRDRLQQAGRPVRQPAARGRAARAALGGRPRARPRRQRRHPPRAHLRRDRGPVRAPVRARARARDGPTPGHRPGESGGGPDLSARDHPRGLRPQHSRQPALAPGRGVAPTSSRSTSPHDPKALVGLQVELARANISDPDPPGWFAALFGTHPTTVQRIGSALASKRGQP